jgi:hypothetical protein
MVNNDNNPTVPPTPAARESHVFTARKFPNTVNNVKSNMVTKAGLRIPLSCE